ncbi:TetR/AcrR family transcriptional regulator [Cytobacillus sp. Hm23]
MKSRKQEIVNSAMKLFARKGYHATSMQEIAVQSGIAKSSLYNYFSSKEELLMTIFKHYYDVLFEKVSMVERNSNLTPKEILIEQISVQLQEAVNYKDFMRLQMREQIIQVNDEIRQYIFRMRSQFLSWYRLRLLEVYGDKIEKHLLDCVTMLNGIQKEYTFNLLVGEAELDVKRMGAFIVRRLDAIVESMMADEEPLLTKSIFDHEMIGERTAKEHLIDQIIHSIHKMREHIQETSLGETEKERYDSTLLALEEEMNKQELKVVLIESLLFFLKNQHDSLINSEVKKIEKLLEIYL